MPMIPSRQRSVCPHPIPIPFYFSLAGRFLNLVWAMGRGVYIAYNNLEYNTTEYYNIKT